MAKATTRTVLIAYMLDRRGWDPRRRQGFCKVDLILACKGVRATRTRALATSPECSAAAMKFAGETRPLIARYTNRLTYFSA